MNVFSFTGNLGQDCRTNNINGTAVINFSVAAKAGFGDKEQTVWIDCAYWGKPAEGRLPEFLVKGQSVGVSGELSTHEKDGKTYLKVRCNSVDLLGSKQDGQQPPQPQYQQPQQPAPMQPQHGYPQGQTKAPQQHAPHPGFTDQGEEIPF